MARVVGDAEVEARAPGLRDLARRTLNEAYWSSERGFHAFALLRSGGTKDDLTVWPAAGLMFGLFDQGPAEATLRHLAADAISTDWGARMLSSGSDLYDPLQYNSGTVWPFVTGFVSLGQYRYRRPWAGFHLMDAVKQMTFDWSLGRHPELLSGAFYSPLDETVPHQFFASSMLPTPLIRGLLGWEPDAPNGAATLAPQLPADWDRLAVRSLWVGGTRVDAVIERGPGRTRVVLGSEGPPVALTYVAALPPGGRDARVLVDGQPLRDGADSSERDRATVHVPLTLEGADRQIDIRWSGGLEVVPPRISLEPGQTSGGMRVIDFDRADGVWRLAVEGESGRTYGVHLVGEPVRISRVAFSGTGTDRTSAAARVVHEEGGSTEIELALPAGEPGRRSVTVYLEEAP